MDLDHCWSCICFQFTGVNTSFLVLGENAATLGTVLPSLTRPYTVHAEEIRYFVDRWCGLLLEGDPYYDRNLFGIKPYTPKTKAETFVLTDLGLGLFEESEPRMLRTTRRYTRIAKTIAIRHGIRRLAVEFLRYLITKGQKK